MHRVAIRHSFILKLLIAAILAAVADALFYFHGIGATLGGFALLWTALLALAAGGMRRSRRARFAALLALLYALVLIETPSPLGWMLFWVALSSAALLVRRRFDNAGDWAIRLAAHVLRGIPAPITDLARLGRLWRSRDAARIGAVIRVAALPCIGGALFATLFAGANPVIGNFVTSIHLPLPRDATLHFCFWMFVLYAVWPSLRPAPAVTRAAPFSFDLPPIRGIPQGSITLSLLTFNAIFLVQNLLDIAFLWSGTPLPGSITLADYAHRGAYLLIVTALLAGLFVLLFLHPGSDAARRPAIRYLVIVWIAQNLLLVTSSILRTWDYVEAYSLTILRISALAWMALVGVGLFLICWRLIAERSTRWLLNANALAAALVLSVASVTDLGAVAAWWNVRHSDRVGQTGNAIDLCYLHRLGSSALLPVIDLEKRAQGPLLQDSIAAIRADLLEHLAADQADWHRWTWRGARRLAAARAALGPNPPRPFPAPRGRDCDGALRPPLTGEAEQ
ncbi:DUF4173 domain-containing protein [Sphingomonas sp. dw_22]|uniref:DUF4153 domain-containing protein n=1 Tax=Sphingomonas sp. dw_22 TaxID=2721175 RepID=UPI001BD2D4B0|nr:DUF4173 domain-containing protein [Sphingomonas sp. dw_22]